MICLIDQCENNAIAKGLCPKHYMRKRTHGDPLVTTIRKRGTGTIRAGYVRINENGKYINEHIRVVENELGEKLPKGAIVHHINKNRSDNRPENLIVCENAKQHRLLHTQSDAIAAGYPAHYRKCHICKKYDSPENLAINFGKIRHIECRRLYAKTRNNLKKRRKSWTIFNTHQWQHGRSRTKPLSK